MSQTIKTRIAQKHDLEANWLKATNFVPLKGELIIYDIEIDSLSNIVEDAYVVEEDGSKHLPFYRSQPITSERFKIGDGVKKVNELPFAVSSESDVKLETDLKTYYNVGKITDASGTNPVTIGRAGDTLRTVFNNLFNMAEVQPIITKYPSVSCTLSSSASDERGTSISTINYSISFDDGKYTYSDSTGVSMTGYSFSEGTTSPNTATTGTITLPTAYIVGTSSAFSPTLTTNYSQGNIAKTNLGNNSNPEVIISAGNTTVTPSFSKTLVDYPYYISSGADTIEALAGQSITKKTTSLSSDTGETCNYNADAYVWIFVRKGTTTTQPTKTIWAYSDIAKDWGAFLGGTEPMNTIEFTKANGVKDTFFAYRTKNTAGAADSVKFRLV